MTIKPIIVMHTESQEPKDLENLCNQMYSSGYYITHVFADPLPGRRCYVVIGVIARKASPLAAIEHPDHLQDAKEAR